MMKYAISVLMSLSLSNYAVAQVIGSGHVLGNASGSSAAATDTALSPLFDSAFCNTNTKIIQRISGTWQCQNLPTSILQNQTFSTPGAVNTLTLTATPLPTAQAQLTIDFDGVIQHPDTWSINTSTGVITFNANIPANVQEVLAQWSSPNIANTGVASFGGLTNTILAGVGLDCASISQTCASQGPVYADVKLFGAKDDCSTDNTTAVQNAWNAAAAAGGKGIVYFPPVTTNGGCYLVGAINATGASGVTVLGNGDQSLIEINNKDADGNWWDLCDSNNIRFERLKIGSNGSTVPKVAFLWCSNTTANSSANHDLLFEKVNVDVNISNAVLFATGYRGLMLRDGVWYNRNNGSSNSNPSERTSVVRLDANNTSTGFTVASVNVTIAHNVIAWQATLDNMTIIDFPSGFGAGTQDNNAAIQCNTCGATLSIVYSQIRCVCDSAFVGWNFVENILFLNDGFDNSDADVSCNVSTGSGCTTQYWARFGGDSGSTNQAGIITFQSDFFFTTAANGGNIAAENYGTGSLSAFGSLNIISPDTASFSTGSRLLTVSSTFSGVTCTSPVTAGWIVDNSHLDLASGSIVICGNIDLTSTVYNPGTIVTPAGVTHTGCKFTTSGISCT